MGPSNAVTRGLIAFLVWAVVAQSGSALDSTYSQDDATAKIVRLRETILKNYEKSVRPVSEHSSITTVKVGLKPLYIIDLDEKNQFMSMDAELILVWKDVRLRWFKDDFRYLSQLHFPDHEVWKPDISIYNSHAVNKDPKGSSLVLVLPSGDVMWIPPTTLTTRCVLDMTDYPNDKQKCDVILGSWTYDSSALVLQPQGDVSLEEFENANPRWELTSTGVKTVKRFYNCCDDAFVTTVFSFTLQRRLPAALQEVWGPTVACLALTLLMFWLPPNSGKKIVLGGFVLLTLVSLLVYVAVTTGSPVTSWSAGSPLHPAFYTVVSAIVLEVILVINMTAASKTRTPPRFLVTLLTGACGKVMCICRPRPDPIDVCLLEGSGGDTPKSTLYEEWGMVARAVDRVLFVIFTVIVVAIYKWP